MSESKANEARREEEKALFEKVSKEVEEILLTNSVALQPFLSFSEFGVLPRVRLVKIDKPETNEDGANSTETEGSESEDGATPAESA